jgi:hypothetical protein
MPMNQQSAKGRVKLVVVTFADLPPDQNIQLHYYPGLCDPNWQAQGRERERAGREYERAVEAAREHGEVAPDRPPILQADGTVEDLLPIIASWDYALTPEDEAAGRSAPITRETLMAMPYDILMAISYAIIADLSPDPTELRRRRSERRSGSGTGNVRARVLPPIEHETRPNGTSDWQPPTTQPPPMAPDPVTTVGASMAQPPPMAPSPPRPTSY